MQRHLFFICPTDHLETVINDAFKQENYYFTSLANSVAFGSESARQINGLIEKNRITEITFVLSDDNHIIKDALKTQVFLKVRGLKQFYNEISSQKNRLKQLWQPSDLGIPVLSHYLFLKVKDLQENLSPWLVPQIQVNAKIYSSKKNTFRAVHPILLFRDHLILN